ncbi:lactate utilization protein [Clostridium sp. LY3-2]|uniref:lactate utilization protein n=1 Tax=Clostridium sp. LY3-2 TaxID=2942482 RepID=UPI0021537B0D|nr:lactate utilization protein [Clostridium sp. LY3-2]MCR6516220.1 lactate utilization protein [Clostridium sp. LY3-2]
MDKIIKWKMECDAKEIVDILNSKYYNARYCKDLEEARSTILNIIPKGSSIALGGSVTLNSLNLLETFRSDDYKLFDRYKDVPFSETVEIMRKSLLADFLVTSTNAVTKKGELVNMDSTGNRAAQMLFGPKKVIVVIGVNKIVSDLDSAYKRIEKVAILNSKRINHKTPCASSSSCSNCDVKDRICNFVSIVNNGRKFEDRFTILVVPENLGY